MPEFTPCYAIEHGAPAEAWEQLYRAIEAGAALEADPSPPPPPPAPRFDLAPVAEPPRSWREWYDLAMGWGR